MLDFPYYGARFTAADNIRKFPQLPMMLLVDNAFPPIPQEEIPLIAFMSAITDVKETDFEGFVNFIKLMPVSSDEEVTANLINLIEVRKVKSTDAGFIAWCDSEIGVMQSQLKSKILIK